MVFLSNTFLSNVRLKLAKNHPKVIEHILNNKQRNKCVYIHEVIINHNNNEDENQK